MPREQRSLFPHVLFLICIVMLISGFVLGGVYLPQALAAYDNVFQDLLEPDTADVLFAQVLPMAGYYEAAGEAYPALTASSVFQICAGINLESPFALLAGQLPAQSSVAATAEPEVFFEESPVPEEKTPQPNISEETDAEKEIPAGDGTVLVGIYSTHTSECYATGETGSPGGIYQVGKALQKGLEEQGVGAVLSDTVHNSPEWQKSYQNSAETASQLLTEYPSIKILVDVHRDAGLTKDMVTTEINGQAAARIMLVVGSDARAQHPNWQQNEAFAEKVAAKMEEMYPGLLREVRVQSGRYNQHLLNTAILTEMGADVNTQEEAVYSGTLLAKVLAAVLAEMA